MRIKRLTLSIVMLAVIFPNLSFGRGLGQSGGKLIEVEKVWLGLIKLELRQQAPPNLFIADEKAWAKLWRTYRGNEKLPKIDFDKQVILVGIRDDTNLIVHDLNLLTLNVDEEGDLKFSLLSNITPIRSPECGYTFVLISREEVKSINGNPIRKDSISRANDLGSTVSCAGREHHRHI